MEEILEILSDMEWEIRGIVKRADDIKGSALEILLDASAKVHLVYLLLEKPEADKSGALIGGGLEDCVIR